MLAVGQDLVTIYASADIQLWRSALQRRAPQSLEHVEGIIGAPIGQGSRIRDVSPQLLDALTNAYLEAARNT
jgi:hypothetical protein